VDIVGAAVVAVLPVDMGMDMELDPEPDTEEELGALPPSPSTAPPRATAFPGREIWASAARLWASETDSSAEGLMAKIMPSLQWSLVFSQSNVSKDDGISAEERTQHHSRTTADQSS
jgi:hypothetical protein